PAPHFGPSPAELEAAAVLRVAAVDLVADPDPRVDVAAAALQEEGEPAEGSLQHLASGTRVVAGGDRRPAADRDGMGRVAEDDGDRVAVEIVDPDDADGRVYGTTRHPPRHVAPVE